jgi:3-methyladenine DNA glycosylase AlkC
MRDVKVPESKLYKDFFNEETVTKFSNELKKIYKEFDDLFFINNSIKTKDYESLSLFKRVDLLAKILNKSLNLEFEKCCKLFLKIIKKFNKYEYMIFTKYIELFGLDNFSVSMNCLKELTKYGTSEMAIKHFIIKYEDESFKLFEKWINDADENVRRLVAEGIRPRGVWTIHIKKFKENPNKVIEILEKLKFDPSKYVQKAVGNCLNDIAKDNEDVVKKIYQKWSKFDDINCNYILKRAVRNIKV